MGNHPNCEHFHVEILSDTVQCVDKVEDNFKWIDFSLFAVTKTVQFKVEFCEQNHEP